MKLNNILRVCFCILLYFFFYIPLFQNILTLYPMLYIFILHLTKMKDAL